MYYPCSKNKGADQLRSYREADLRLCFRLCRFLVFSQGGSYISFQIQYLSVEATYTYKSLQMCVVCLSTLGNYTIIHKVFTCSTFDY